MNNQLEITHRGTARLLDIDEINYIKSDNVYVEIFTKDRRYIQRKFLGQISNELPDHFLRVHRSYLVNRFRITAKTKSYIMIEDQKIPISRKFNLDEVEG